MIVTDKGGYIVACNEKWLSVCGYKAEEVLGNTPKILHGVNTQVEDATRFAHGLYSTGSAEVSLLNYTKSGKEFTNNINAALIHVTKSKYVESLRYFQRSLEAMTAQLSDTVKQMPAVRAPQRWADFYCSYC